MPHVRAVAPYVLAFALLLLSATPTDAFKPRTHVWIGQQILNDLADGCSDLVGEESCITLRTCVDERDGIFHPWSPDAPCRDREYRVAPEIANALLRNPQAYRAGHVGPDAFPDLIVGQTTAHPGTEGGWQTDDWLRWMLRHRRDGGKEMAFAYGYLGHAAGDVFAHTYVNAYAGGAFDLLDGEQEVERRHVALEEFIERHTPAIVDPGGRPVPADDLLAVPALSLGRRLVRDDAVSDQYARSGTAPHLRAMYGVERGLEEAIKLVDFPTVESDLLDRLGKLEEELERLVLEIDALTNPLARARQHLAAAQKVVGAHQRKIEAQRQAVERAAQEAENLLAARDAAVDRLRRFPDDKARLEREIGGLKRRLDDVPREIVSSTTRRVCESLGPLKSFCKSVTKPVRVVNELHSQLSRQVDGARRSLSGLERKAVDAQRAVDEFAVRRVERESIRAAAQAELKRLELVALADESGQKALDVATRTVTDLEARHAEMAARVAQIHSAVDPLRGPFGELRKVRAYLEGWLDDVIAGTSAYIAAGRDSAQAMIEHENLLAPYVDWLSCWAPAYTGVPAPVGRATCAVVRSVEEIKELIDSTRKEARDAFGETGGWLVDPLGKLEEEVDKKLQPAIASAAVDFVGIAGEEWKTFASLLIEGFSEEKLNEVFADDDSGLGLLLLPDVSNRVRRDMAVIDRHFSPTGFAAAYDAVVLSKLSLLDAAELNRLARDCGWWPDGPWGETLYQPSEPFNVLLRSVRSIDGDHQWNRFAPPYPRQRDDRSRAKDREYGRHLPDGLRLWASCKARKLVFRGIFKGPLNPGLLDALPPHHPYRPTAENPFPDIPGNQECPEGVELDEERMP